MATNLLSLINEASKLGNPVMPNVRPAGSVSHNNAGRVALVSGGANGIGRAICDAFNESGATVVCMDVDEAAATTLNESINFVRGDTSMEEDCQNAVSFAVEQHGGLDILVNNAAIQPPSSYVPLDELPAELWDRMLAINLSGYTFLAKHAVRVMKQQTSGVIVNMSSGQAHRTARQVPTYGPIKAANLHQARQWGIEYARDGIRVVSVSPGAIDTPLVRASLEAQGGEKELANRHPLGRIGKPDEVAAAVLWLSSPAASFVTATDLEVDGGLGAFGSFADPYPMPE
ncbi:MAG: NAD(P)-dependent dehydrogenase (short-subunit alcohol dehydrogenase family) [Planctomycetaceae bacterium]|jgi:NAD(P)-dependent dehydrogenase (short-subunit alcohol dehydrogenase family)